MVNKADKNVARLRRHRRVRGKISGTAVVPRWMFSALPSTSTLRSSMMSRA